MHETLFSLRMETRSSISLERFPEDFLRRLSMIGILSPFLCRLGYGLKWQDAVVMTWGGLRGAVGLALALSVARNPYIEHPEVGHKILIHVSGIVMLTLLVNATTTNMLLRVLGELCLFLISTSEAISPTLRRCCSDAFSSRDIRIVFGRDFLLELIESLARWLAGWLAS